jgi:hypothetical protein
LWYHTPRAYYSGALVQAIPNWLVRLKRTAR